jgi:RHS repeat-associated protein
MYLPFGGTRWESGATPTDFQFTGQRKEAGFGLYDYNARYYDPLIGRFVSPDTIVPEAKNPQDLNRYSYTRNNPIRYTDSTGHCLDAGGGGAGIFNCLGGGGMIVVAGGAALFTSLTVQAMDQARGKTRDPNEMTKGAEKAWADLQAGARHAGTGGIRPPSKPPNNVQEALVWIGVTTAVAGTVCVRLLPDVCGQSLDPSDRKASNDGLRPPTPTKAPTGTPTPFPTGMFFGPDLIATRNAEMGNSNFFLPTSTLTPTPTMIPTTTPTATPTPTGTWPMTYPDDNWFIE